MDANPARVGALADDAQLQLAIRISTFIPQQLEPRTIKRQEQICIAIQVEVRGMNAGDGSVNQFVEAKDRGYILKSAAAKIAPGKKPPTSTDDVEPAIVVIIHQHQRGDLPAVEWNPDR